MPQRACDAQKPRRHLRRILSSFLIHFSPSLSAKGDGAQSRCSKAISLPQSKEQGNSPETSELSGARNLDDVTVSALLSAASTAVD